MGIRTFESQEVLLARGFHTVYISAPSSWVHGQNVYDDWCQQTLQGEYDIRLYSSKHLTGFFRAESDAMLFALKWS